MTESNMRRVVATVLAVGWVVAACSNPTAQSPVQDAAEASSPTTDQPSESPSVQTRQDQAPSPQESEPPLYMGNDAAFDLLVAMRDSIPRKWRIDADALPTKLDATSRVLTEMVSPERCADLASVVEGGFLAEEGPLQFISDPDPSDNLDNFVIIGQAPVGALDEMLNVADKCATFDVARQSPSVINSSPTTDRMTYSLAAQTLDDGSVLLTVTGDGQVQQVDTNYRCLDEGEGFCMYRKSINALRLLRQSGENLIDVGTTRIRLKGGSASRPMKAQDFLQVAQPLSNQISN